LRAEKNWTKGYVFFNKRFLASMGAKKKSKKGKKDKGNAEETVEEKAIPLVEDNYLNLEFRMLNWKYMNFNMRFREETHIFTIKKLLAERHGRVDNMKICLDAFSESNEIKNEMLTLKECGLKGRPPQFVPGPDGEFVEEEGSVPTAQVFYDFKPLDYSDPIMLHFNS
jgi:hypothetical protein